MSIELHVFQKDGIGFNAWKVIDPGQTEAPLITVSDDEPSQLLVYEVACWKDNTGGVFRQYTLEDRGQLYDPMPFDFENEEIIDTKTYEIINGEAGQWELPSDMVAVFHHTTGPKRYPPLAFYK